MSILNRTRSFLADLIAPSPTGMIEVAARRPTSYNGKPLTWGERVMMPAEEYARRKDFFISDADRTSGADLRWSESAFLSSWRQRAKERAGERNREDLERSAQDAHRREVDRARHLLAQEDRRRGAEQQRQVQLEHARRIVAEADAEQERVLRLVPEQVRELRQARAR